MFVEKPLALPESANYLLNITHKQIPIYKPEGMGNYLEGESVTTGQHLLYVEETGSVIRGV